MRGDNRAGTYIGVRLSTPSTQNALLKQAYVY